MDWIFRVHIVNAADYSDFNFSDGDIFPTPVKAVHCVLFITYTALVFSSLLEIKKKLKKVVFEWTKQK